VSEQQQAPRAHSREQTQPQRLSPGTDAYDLIKDMRSEVRGVNGRAYDYWGEQTYEKMKGNAREAIERTWANPEAASFLKQHGNTKEDMLKSVAAGRDAAALSRVPDFEALTRAQEPTLASADRLVERFEKSQAANVTHESETAANLQAGGRVSNNRNDQAQRAGEQFWQSVANQARSDQGRVEAQAEKAGERAAAKATQGDDAQPRRGARMRM